MINASNLITTSTNSQDAFSRSQVRPDEDVIQCSVKWPGINFEMTPIVLCESLLIQRLMLSSLQNKSMVRSSFVTLCLPEVCI